MINIEKIRKGTIVKYINSASDKYIITNTNIRFRFNGIWYNGIGYRNINDKPKDIKIRSVEDFMTHFEYVKK